MKMLLIANIAPHYRSSVYQLIDQELSSDFVFGDRMQDIKPMDYSQLSHQVTMVHNVFFKHFYYQRDVLRYVFRDYDTYLFTGEFRCLSTWSLLVLLRLFPQKRSFIWTHGWLGKESHAKRMLTLLFFRLANGIFVYNNRSRKLMIEGGVPPRKVTAIFNSLDYEKQLAIRNSLHISEIYQQHFRNTNKVLIFIGRLTKVKKLGWLIDALELLCRRGENYNLVLVGDGCERSTLEKYASEKHLSDSVWFCGACYNEYQNADYLYNADVCVSPGNVGLTAIHAMTYGCPVITNDDFCHQMPEFEAIERGVTGDFFKMGDVTSMADTISSWFNVPLYDRHKIRQECYKKIDSNWTPKHQVEIFKSMMSDR